MQKKASLLCAAIMVFLLVAAPAGLTVERPFVFWNGEELQAIRHRIEAEEWARVEWEREPDNQAEERLRDLLAYRLFGDKEAGERQKERVLKVIRSRPPLGGAQWLVVVAFDMVHDRFSDAERAEVERVFRDYIEEAIFQNALFDPEVFNTSKNYQRYDAKHYTRTNWLPNITWPRRVSANLMAAALGDESLIRRVWSHYGSWKWYFDEYLSDGGFYGEEFSKMGATPGAMIVYCRAVRNLGLNRLGFGYRGRSGATMRGHIESVMWLGYPRVTLHSGRPSYPMLTTGDLRGQGSSRQGKNLPTFAFQHSIVRGYLPGPAKRGIHRWQAHGAWGGEMRGDNPQWDGYGGFVPKMQIPLWFEAAHVEWPDAGFDYFLAQMCAPDRNGYSPTLLFGVAPVEPSAVEAPAAPSWVAEDRGLAMLRADESAEYWESPKPAVGVRLGANYAHNVDDCFTLSGFYALNRPIYLNRQTRRGYAFGYSRSVLSHCGVMVDGAEPQFTTRVATRHGFYPPFKFLTYASSKVYAGVDATRALVLTDRYLLDLYQLRAKDGRSHDYVWVVHALGSTEPSGWRKVELEGPLGAAFHEAFTPARGLEVTGVSVVQDLALENASQASLPRAWYERRVGVHLSVLGDLDGDLYVARTPTDDSENKKLKDAAEYLQLEEVGGTSIILRSKSRDVSFVTLHVPFEGGKAPPVRAVRHKTSDEQVLVVEVIDERDGEPREWVFVDLRAEEERREAFAVEIDGQGTFQFVDHAMVQLTGNQVAAWGDLRALRLEDPPRDPAFSQNGRITRWGD